MLLLCDQVSFLKVLILLAVKQGNRDAGIVFVQLGFCELLRVDGFKAERFDFVPVRVFTLVAPSSINDRTAIREHYFYLNVRLHLRETVDVILVQELVAFLAVLNVRVLLSPEVLVRLALSLVVVPDALALSKELLVLAQELPTEGHVLALDNVDMDHALRHHFETYSLTLFHSGLKLSPADE